MCMVPVDVQNTPYIICDMHAHKYAAIHVCTAHARAQPQKAVMLQLNPWCTLQRHSRLVLHMPRIGLDVFTPHPFHTCAASTQCAIAPAAPALQCRCPRWSSPCTPAWTGRAPRCYSCWLMHQLLPDPGRSRSLRGLECRPCRYDQ